VSPIRVLLADDHVPTRADVRQALEADPDMVVIAEASDAPGAVEAAIAEQPDVCLLDVRMPGSGIAAVWEIAARCPGTRIIMLSISSDDADLFGALRAGADGYLLKDMEATRIPFAVRDVLAGKAALPRALTARVLEEFRDTAPRWRSVDLGDGAERLTSREWEVVALLRRGLTTRQIAKRLVLTPATVRTHVAAAVRKLGVPDRESLLQQLDRTAE
jgi:DNA-binding NarL/FixJ family response regulator